MNAFSLMNLQHPQLFPSTVLSRISQATFGFSAADLVNFARSAMMKAMVQVRPQALLTALMWHVAEYVHP